jgi:hypothetical protein
MNWRFLRSSWWKKRTNIWTIECNKCNKRNKCNKCNKCNNKTTNKNNIN